MAVLAIIFAVVFAFQRRSSGDDTSNQPSLTDPNSQPVQSLTPPTGSAETHIAPVVSATPTAPVVTATPETATDNANVEVEGTPESGVTNSNRSRPQNTNEETRPTPEATPTQSNRNVNRRAPVVNTNSDTIPSPAPPPTQRESPSSEVMKPSDV